MWAWVVWKPFAGTLVSTTRVLISEFDASASASGALDLQTGTAPPTGGYAFNLGGLDGIAAPNGPNALVIGGVLNITGSSISVSNSVFDFNDVGSVSQAQAFSSGSVTAADAFGRFTISLTPNSASGLPAIWSERLHRR